jgi:hypothetical protein
MRRGLQHIAEVAGSLRSAANLEVGGATVG